MKSASMAAAVALALVLAAAFGFLYYKTETGEVRRQIQLLGSLRELKDIDARWDVELTRLRSESGAARASAGLADDRLKRAIEGLDANAGASALVATLVSELKRAFAEKADLVEKYRVPSSAARERLDSALAALPEINTALRQTRLADPRQRDRVAAMEYSASLVQSELLRYNLTSDSTQRARLEAAVAAMKQADMPGNPALPAMIDRYAHDAEQFLKLKAEEQGLYTRLAFLPVGPRLDSLSAALHREIEATMEEKERFRVYLVAFAGSLLILLSHIGARLRQSYREVADANDALKVANEGLEQRVQERTRELSLAMKRLEESQAMLVQTEKMSSLGQMVAGIAHEINTPLAYVKNSLDTVDQRLPDLTALLTECEKLLRMLRAGANEQEFGKQYGLVAGLITRLRGAGGAEDLPRLIQDGRYGITQISEIVVNLRNFSRLDRSRVDRFNVADGLESTLSIAKHVLKSITVKKQFGAVPAITCSPSQLNQVFLNLITNAAQATEGKAGEITLTTRAPDQEHVEIEVADNGKGIPAEVLPRIFDPFFTTKDVGKGTGLGLSIAYKIIEAHGGKIRVDTRPGAGTRFTVRLPVHPPAEPATA